MPIQVYDINSAYQDAMDKIMHPVGSEFSIDSGINANTFFVCWEGENRNAVPMREKAGLNFASPYGIFWSTIHEYNTALDLGMISPKRIVHSVGFKKSMLFSDFVQHFFSARKIAKAAGNDFLDIFYKLILNSSYGKFAQDPESFSDSIILPYGEIPEEHDDANPLYKLAYQHNKYAIWEKPSLLKTYFNVGTAASITGAVRSVLLRGIASSTRPLYCDTDSIFCASMIGNLDDKELGAWKHETFKIKKDNGAEIVYTEGTQIAIAGKKLYALMNGDDCIKKASKGVNLHPLAIFAAARGDTIETRNDAPSFKMGFNTIEEMQKRQSAGQTNPHLFIQRNVRRTGAQKDLLS
jgi:hypothetical protein